ncbi:hypothetical protein [Fibrobacter sp.]
MNYKIKECFFNNGESYLTVLLDDEKLFPVNAFIRDDFTPFSKEYLEIFDNVLSGKVEKDSASGNSCSFEVDKDKTVIEFLYPEDENETEICTVNTRELRALMDEWLQKRAEFLNGKK